MGLDDITAAVMNGLTTLSKVSEIISDKMLTKNIEKGKCYFKSSFKTHSTTFTLSDKADEMLAEKSTTIEGDCDECIEILSCLKDVEEFVKGNGNDDTIYDVSVVMEDIKTYIKQQVRDAKQKLAKVLAFQSIDEETAFWLKDYCQKVLPTKYGEGQKEYFGKKGMSLHVDILCMKKDGVFVKKVYFTAIY